MLMEKTSIVTPQSCRNGNAGKLLQNLQNVRVSSHQLFSLSGNLPPTTFRTHRRHL